MSERILVENSVNNLDSSNIFFQKIETLPLELAERWQNEYDNLEDPEDADFFKRFNSFLEKRKQIHTPNLEFAPETPDDIVKEIILLREEIVGIYGNSAAFLGAGRTAETYIHPKCLKVCIKFIKDVESYTKTDIPLYKEYERLRDLQNFEFASVRTPVPYFESTNGEHLYGMERIMGNTLIQIMQEPDKNIDLVKLAKTLDRKIVLDNLISYVKEMHVKFKITHNDLEVINIMLGNNGNFYIIDFGKSKYEEIGEDHELNRDKDISNVKIAVQEFFNRIDILEIADIV